MSFPFFHTRILHKNAVILKSNFGVANWHIKAAYGQNQKCWDNSNTTVFLIDNVEECDFLPDPMEDNHDLTDDHLVYEDAAM